jgi:hypothetical protein
MEEPPIPPRQSTRSSAPPPYTPWYSAYGFIILSEEEEKKLSHLEKTLVANVDFDDQALNSLGFGTNTYYMFGHLGWVQFSNGVSANTHKKFVLEILMTMAPIFDEGCQVYHSDWREFSKWFSMSILGSYLGFKRGLLRKFTCWKACWMDFGI